MVLLRQRMNRRRHFRLFHLIPLCSSTLYDAPSKHHCMRKGPFALKTSDSSGPFNVFFQCRRQQRLRSPARSRRQQLRSSKPPKMAAWRSLCKTSSRKRLPPRRRYSRGKAFTSRYPPHTHTHTRAHTEAVAEHDARVTQELAEMQTSICQILGRRRPRSLLSLSSSSLL